MADGRWSDLPMDILSSVLERLSFVYFNRAKMVCSHWYLCSKQTSPQKSGSPMLIMCLEDGGCGLYHPKEARVYKTKGDLPKIKFLANSGNWFLVLDSNKSSLYIIDILSQKKMDLPPLESIKGCQYKVKRVGHKTFKEVGTRGSVIHKARHLRGLLWVDKKKEEFVVVWYFHRIKYMTEYLAFCKNGENHYHEIPASLQDVSDMVLPCGDSLYVLTTSNHIRKLTFTYKEGFKDILAPFCLPSLPTGLYHDDECRYNIAVRPSGEILVVMSIFYGSSRPWMLLLESSRPWMFLLYKKNPYRVPDNRLLVKVDSLGDEALFLDLGITVPANRDLGIEPNSIYFSRTRHAFSFQKSSSLYVCVFNIATKTFKRFPGFFNIKLEGARWFLPS
ncbi:PREDICTED: F-box protein At5g25290-like [Camelina sativa]|uniref:F-box protein At5g25290-like n=1 Tax=Camelina sativa TaxID=90675 RepID=A0ABM0X0C8_CAMSA|nr:PREDICTED: F-box protein At5g25290-like [Camelina sativa]